MRLLAVILLSLVILLSVCRGGIVKSIYIINKTYIQDELCVEKDILLSTCNGSCWVAAQLNEPVERNSAIPIALAEIVLPTIHSVIPKIIDFTSIDHLDQGSVFVNSTSRITCEIVSRLLRPPILLF